ncbi:hypothetical protein EJ05DRAFT_538415 [Pseudovirgaria hyperparasitica]|uniref:Large ribosomal subunit protein mL49 n=1 Tax=Pseudovirgaria hyperparasitica TaxID=470096 RepID=A0A6A6W9C3_9PEZI|nr:uncharacterized protein EJ05DRAFT_538415 [Pseudovirgaria hyperparasitica]KAF2758187.1 hypothetical protein EJ05DRAFT_538415 [Pseudovirgaria hyperparasitica]
MALRSQLSLSFLRPLAPPQPATIRSFMRINSPQIRRLETSAPSSRISNIEPVAVPATSPHSAATQTPSDITKTDASGSRAPAAEKLPYFVQRTPSGQLPVYRDSKAHGMKKLVKIRKLHGNLDVLATEIKDHLELPNTHVNINRLTGHIDITCPGGKDVAPQVLKFLVSKGL